jgi:tetratricopeptide (TPR) repeat protein
MAKRDKILRDAEKLVQKGKVEQAIREYEKLLKLTPGDANTINRVGDLYGRIGQVDKAIELYERIADSFTKDGFTTKAIAILKKINRIAPQRLDIFNRLADLYIQQGLLVEAKSQYQMLAEWYSKSGDDEQAIEVHKKLVQLDPNNHMAHLRLADLLMQTEQPEEAVEVYQRLGEMLLQRDKLDEAERLYRHALEQNPPTGELFEPLCTALIESGRAPAAQEFLTAALERSPESSKLQILGVRLRLALGQAQEALETSQELLKAYPHDSEVRSLVGRVFLSAGDADQARDLLVPAIEDFLNRDEYPEAQELLQELLNAIPRDQEVLDVAIRAYEPSGEAEVLYGLRSALADEYFTSGQLEAAGRLYVELIRVEPENATFKERLSQCDGVTDPGVSVTEPRAQEAPRESEVVEFDVPDEAEPLPEPEPVVDQEPDQEPVEILAEPESAPESAPAASQFDPLERLAEANVFAKYGLVEKAVHHLEQILGSFPDHVEAREKLVQLFLEQRRRSDAAEAAGPLVDHYRSVDDAEAIERLEEWLPEMTAAAEPPAAGELEFVTDGIIEEDEDLLVVHDEEVDEDDVSFDVHEVADEEPIAAAEVIDEPEAEMADDEDFSLVIDAEELVPVEEDEAGYMAADALAAADPEEIETLSDGSAADLEDFEVEVIDAADADAAAAMEAATLEEPAIDSLEPDEASVEEPDEVEVAEVSEAADVEEPVAAEESAPTLSELDELERSILGSKSPAEIAEDVGALLSSAVDQADGAQQSPPSDQAEPLVEVESDGPAEELVELSTSFTGPSLSDLEQVDFFIEQELYDDAIRLLDRLEEEFPGDDDIGERRLALKSMGVLLESVAAAGEGPEELFADEEEYIDLAKELEEELAEEEAMVEEATGRGRDEAHLEEVFREFQKGVAEQLSEEDSDTHFNLGIAYKEMGLLPEAIREFQVAARDERFFIECCSMIGVCYVEQGMYDQAAEWYSKALESPEVADDARIALRYDLASALEMAGDTRGASELWDQIAALAPDYRDVASRRAALS